MNYFITSTGLISRHIGEGAVMTLPAENNGTPEWREYLDWLAQGNTPEPAPPPPPPGPDYLAFWDALLVSNVYQTIRAQALTSAAVLVAVTECIAAIQDAKAGRPNVPAIQMCLFNLLGAATFTENDLDELRLLFVVGNLQDIFTLEP
jgi:hypothetical protein